MNWRYHKVRFEFLISDVGLLSVLGLRISDLSRYRISTATFSLFFSESSFSVKPVPMIVAGLRNQRGELELSTTSATDLGSDDPFFIIGDP